MHLVLKIRSQSVALSDVVLGTSCPWNSDSSEHNHAPRIGRKVDASIRLLSERCTDHGDFDDRRHAIIKGLKLNCSRISLVEATYCKDCK